MKKNLRLLLVDDDAEDRALFTDAVRQVDETIQCIELSNGEQALQHLADMTATLPDFIFLDLRMPRVSGKKCLMEIKKSERLRNIPIYIYTTSRDVEESKELMAIGAVHFISKPNNTDDIYFLLATAIEEHHLLSKYEQN